MLYAHLIEMIYAGELKRRRWDTIQSVSTIHSPSAFGLRLNAAMPIRFELGRQSYGPSSLDIFIDVADGVKRLPEVGSSWNVQKIDAIDLAILKLMSVGISQEDISVITDYSEQKRLLTQRSKENG